MKRLGWGLVLGSCLLLVGAGHTTITAADVPESPTYTKDVLPILQKNCQSCHRPGQIGPFSMLSYESVRPWARSMKTRVVSRQMPPWFAEHGNAFANDRSLKQDEIDTIAKWVDNGAPQGDTNDAPAPVPWPEDGWQIKPDLIVRLPDFVVPAKPAKNVIEWVSVTVPSGFTQDTWVTTMELKPSDLSVTHHICLTFVPHRETTKYYEFSWSESPRDDDGVATDTPGSPAAVEAAAAAAAAAAARRAAGNTGNNANGPGGGQDMGGFACYVPGVQADDYRPYNAAKLIRAGADINIQYHYTPSGKETVDRPQLGFMVADKAPEKRWISYQISGAAAGKFAIPPHEANYQSPPAEAEIGADSWMVQMMPHMHLRGKSMKYKLIFPDGTEKVILNVPKYDFNWQLVYQPMEPVFMPKGTKLHVDAVYDNSTGNKFNPDPNRTVYPGRMTWEEMMNPFFGIIVDSNTDPSTVLKLRGNTVVGEGA
ncbi:MAG: cytochrome c [Acidobacteria bacterium]|nr:cytochrome c [Acidobacteriota bacterium]